MTYKEFKKFRDEFLTEACLLSDNKSVEYTISNKSKLYNFIHVAERLGTTPQQALMGYVCKHFDALCNEAKTGKVFSDEAVRSRCLDIANYMILYAALHEHTKETNNDDNLKSDRSESGSSVRSSQNDPEPKEWSDLARTTET
jgi:hypothetical protein|tara:strand:- start:1579 stop:2007 length:429 start_codon:yes stop_codon:yes gene_type:complete